MNPRALKKASKFVTGAIKGGGITVSEGERTAFKLLSFKFNLKLLLF